MHLARQFRWHLLTAALASVSAGALSVFLLAQINTSLTEPSLDRSRAAGVFVGLALATMLAGLTASLLFERLRHRVQALLRRCIAERAMAAPFRELEQVGGSRLLAALTEHASAIAQFFVNLPVLLTNGVAITGCLVYLAILSPPIFGVALALIAAGSVGYHFANVRALRYLRSSALEHDRLAEHFRGLIEGAKELRLHRRKREVFAREVLGRSIDAVCEQRMRGMTIFLIATSWGHFLIYAFIGLVLFALVPREPGQTRVMTGFALIFVYLVTPLQSLLISIPSANLAKVASNRIDAVLAQLRSAERAAASARSTALQQLTLAGVTHRYYHEHLDEVFELGPIDLVIHPAQIFFIVGGNGSGKTTLAKLLAGLYAPEQGRIQLNGESIDDGNRDQFRQHFSAIFSDFHLFERTLDARGADADARGNSLLARLRLQHKVQMRDGAFTTRELSHGQRKRLALVVACLEDRPIVLFDEWAADQDPVFKDVFYQELLPELRAQGKAVIAITHDERYFHLADQLVRMENGCVMPVDSTAPRAAAASFV